MGVVKYSSMPPNRNKKNQDKKPRGRPEARKIERIETTPEELARAIFRNADRELQASKKIKFGE